VKKLRKEKEGEGEKGKRKGDGKERKEGVKRKKKRGECMGRWTDGWMKVIHPSTIPGQYPPSSPCPPATP
jgi:hypothetical protein